MDYIYIEVTQGERNNFMNLLDSTNIPFDYLGYNTFMIHKMYFCLVGKILDCKMIKSFASSIEGLL